MQLVRRWAEGSVLFILEDVGGSGKKKAITLGSHHRRKGEENLKEMKEGRR